MPATGVSYNSLRARLAEVDAFARAVPEATDYFRNKYAKLADDRTGRLILGLFKYELRVAGIDPEGCRILDAGCGSGMFSVLFGLLGGRSVDAIDLFPENAASLGRLASACGLPIRARAGNVCATGLADSSVDVVYCREAISHFSDWRAFLAEVGRVLAPGGRILVSDWNNGASPVVRGEVRRLWKDLEIGPFTVDRFRPEAGSLPYLFRRWMIFHREFPELTDDQVFHLGLRTAGQSGDALRESARHLLTRGEMPDAVYRPGDSVRRPEDGQTTEEPVDPREIVRILRGLGVRARARAHFGFNRSRLLPILNNLGALVPGVSLRLAHCYLVHGELTARSGRQLLELAPGV